MLSREEVLDLFFEDLELPDMVKLNLKEILAFKPRRAGFTTTGSPTNINVGRTMRNSLWPPHCAEASEAGGAGRDRRRDRRRSRPIRGPAPRRAQRIAELREELERLRAPAQA